jgi:hypothetical protein
MPHRSGQKRDGSLIVRVKFWPGGYICDVERPHDLEALEHSEDLVVYLEPFTRRLPGEIASMGIEPLLSRAVSPPPHPRRTPRPPKIRLDCHLGGSPDELWIAFAVDHDHQVAGLRHRVATVIVITQQADGSPLDPRRGPNRPVSVPISRLSPNVNIRGYGLHSSLTVHTAMNRSTTESIG